MKRIGTLVAGAFVIVGVTAVTTTAAPAPSAPTRESAAKHLLKSPIARLLTFPALTALQRIAGEQRPAAAADAKLGSLRIGVGGFGPPAFRGSISPNTRVNDPAEDTHQVDQTTQSETSVAVRGRNVVVGYNDSQQTPLNFEAGTNLSGYAYSVNGGDAFTDGGTIRNAPEFVNIGDPWLASDRTGAMYYSTLAFDAFNGNLDVNIAKSTDGGKTFTAANPIRRPAFDEFYESDKPALTAGPDPLNTSRDRLYDTWTDFFCDRTGCFTGIPVARSADGAKTWQISYADKTPLTFDESCSGSFYTGTQPLVAPDGTLYVFAEKIAIDDPNCDEHFVVRFSEVVFRSTNGGQSFGPAVKIADVTPAAPDELLKLGPGRYMRLAAFPTAAVARDALYVAWNDGASGLSHIRLAKSTNGGATWSLSWATQGSNDELQPAASADAFGLHLLYYRRNGDNTLDVLVSNSVDGARFDTVRVTSRSFPGVFTVPPFDPIIGFAYMGDYIANVSNGFSQYFAWGDNRDRVTNFIWPQGRNDPNVYFAKQATFG